MTNEQNGIIKFVKDNPLTENKDVLIDFIKTIMSYIQEIIFLVISQHPHSLLMTKWRRLY